MHSDKPQKLRRAGLDVLRIINEPTAAAMAYGMAQERAAAPGASWCSTGAEAP